MHFHTWGLESGLNFLRKKSKSDFVLAGLGPGVPYSGICPGWIFSLRNVTSSFLLLWLIMTNFGMSALLSIGCTDQSCLLDREKVSFGPVTSGFLPENHLWIGVIRGFLQHFPVLIMFFGQEIVRKPSLTFTLCFYHVLKLSVPLS